MSKYKPGKELRVREKERIRKFEFFNDYIKRGLQPYNDSGKPVSPPDLSLKIFSIKSNLRNAKRELEEKIFSIGPARIRVIKAVQDQLPTDLLEIEKRVEILQKELSSIDYSWKDFSLPESTKKTEKILNDLDGYLYIEEEVLKIAEKHNLPLPDKKFEKSLEQPVKEVEAQKSADLKKDECVKNPAFMRLLKEYNADIRLVWKGIVKDARDREVSIAASEVSDLQEAAKYIMEDPDYSFKRLKAEDFVDNENLFREARDTVTPNRYFRETLNQAMMHKYTDKKDITKTEIRDLLLKNR